MSISRKLHIFQNYVFNIVIILSYTLFIAIALGLSAKAPEYLDELQYYVKIYVSLFLIYRFNPFRKIEFTDLDRKIAFSSGLFLFTTSALNDILKKYTTQIEHLLSKYI